MKGDGTTADTGLQSRAEGAGHRVALHSNTILLCKSYEKKMDAEERGVGVHLHHETGVLRRYQSTTRESPLLGVVGGIGAEGAVVGAVGLGEVGEIAGGVGGVVVWADLERKNSSVPVAAKRTAAP